MAHRTTPIRPVTPPGTEECAGCGIMEVRRCRGTGGIATQGPAVAVTAVFLDLYQTVAHLHPGREQRLIQTLLELGFQAEARDLARGYLAADHHYTLAGMKTPIHLMSPAEKEQTFLRCQEIVLEVAGLAQALPLAGRILKRYRALERVFRPFPDALPALAELKDAGYRIGLITNVDRDPTPELERIGLREWFDSITASCLVGCEKPDVRLFQAAMDALGVTPSQAVHVGDQLLADVEGAKAAGLRAILLDRHDLQEGRHPDRIRGLLELVPLLQKASSDA